MNRMRQKDILPENRLADLTVTIIGCGAVGSITAVSLAKMGVGRLVLYDPDSVEDHNLPNQWFKATDIGQLKVEALAETISDYADDAVVESRPEKYRGRKFKSNVVVCCIDNMEGRHFIWKRVKEQRPPLYIDSRMGPEISQVFCVGYGHSEEYESFRLIPPSEAVQERCTAKATIYGANQTAAIICAAVRRYVTEAEVIPALTLDLVNGICLREAA
jgi:molybdopterin/thiamine biosynthesis adenylyltransferase